MKRRTFLWGGLLGGGALAAGALYGLRAPSRRSAACRPRPSTTPERVSIADVKDPEDVFAWLQRVHGGYNLVEYRRVLGAANPYKEGDAAQGLAAADEPSRENSRRLLANTTIRSLLAHPIFEDEVVRFADAQVDPAVRGRIEPWTVGELVRFLLDAARGRDQGASCPACRATSSPARSS